MEDMDLTRRNLLTAAGAAGIGAFALQAAPAQEVAQVAQPATTEGSGATLPAPQLFQQTVVVAHPAVAAAAGPHCFFGRITPDASPGRNTLTISGLPAGTRCISVWMTEFVAPNQPHAGGAFFYTTSVQLFNNGTQCRVIFNLDWGKFLPAACQVIYM